MSHLGLFFLLIERKCTHPNDNDRKVLGLTIAGQNDYCDTITIVENTIAILLLLQLRGHILLKIDQKFVKISVLTMSVVEILLNATNMPKYFNKMN